MSILSRSEVYELVPDYDEVFANPDQIGANQENIDAYYRAIESSKRRQERRQYFDAHAVSWTSKLIGAVLLADAIVSIHLR